MALHTVWLLGLWYLVIYQDPVVSTPWIFAYLVLEAARGWVIAALGSRWTTRIIVVPGETLVDEGPYRYFRHPNYMVVAGEIFILPMAFGLWWYAVIFGVPQPRRAVVAHPRGGRGAEAAPRRASAATEPEPPVGRPVIMPPWATPPTGTFTFTSPAFSKVSVISISSPFFSGFTRPISMM